jgi:hypothetical protein
MERPTNLVECWLQAATPNGERHADALAQLNAALGTRHRLNRLYEWRAGTYPVPAPVQVYMLRATLVDSIRAEGGTVPDDAGAFTDRLLPRLLPPPRVKPTKTR